MTAEGQKSGADSKAPDDLISVVEDLRGGGEDGMVHAHRPWWVLIVDDEEEVHRATRFALSGYTVNARAVEFAHAYSAAEARAILASDSDIAVILLDVVMETADAGLKLVSVIREELGLSAVRIVLRTGQPGYAPELQVIQQYDINDYKTKSELTRTRLATTLTSAIRSYEQIRTIEASRSGLDKIVHASADLFARRGMGDFCDGVLTQICALLRLAPEGLVCAGRGPVDPGPRVGDDLVVVGAAGRYRDLIERPLAALGNARVEDAIRRTIREARNLYEQGYTTLYLRGRAAHEVAVFVDTAESIVDMDRRLIEVFAANISIGFDNVALFERLHQYAYYDQLCGVPNRNKFVALIDEQLKRGGDGWVAAIVDIDHFSETNDGLGHERGDLLLMAVAERLRTALGPEVVVARVGGDHFGVLGTEAAIDPERLLALFSDPFQVDEYQLRVSATAGLVRLGQTGGGIVALKDANLALKRAKMRTRGRYFYYTETIEEETRERVKLAHDLRQSIDTHQLLLYYQPQIALASGRPVGAEALLRWRTAEGHFVPPDKFIPVAEHSGLIRPIGEWVLRAGCRQLRSWRAAGLRDFRLAVNVSLDQFRVKGFPDLVRTVVQENGIDPRSLELEITESMAMDDMAIVTDTLEQLSRIGVGVAIDDFGTGFSSLAYLRQLRVDRLKIDRHFVSELTSDTGHSSIPAMVVTLGHDLGLEVVAEGVETPEQAEKLRELGCDLAQGYHYLRPVDTKAFDAWLISQRLLTAASAA